MTFDEVLNQAIELLKKRGRLTYRTVKRQFHLDEAALEDLKFELIEGQRLATDENGTVLVWTGETKILPELVPSSPQPSQPLAPQAHQSPRPDAERRQLTVMFCDIVDSTPLSERLDPEDLREVVRAYQQTCAAVIQRFDGHIAQLLGDALLVYFGWPQAHEDDAQRAVRASLGMLEAVAILNTHLEQEKGVRLATRVGIHTGLVVVGEMGSGGRQEQLALGKTLNVAARIQGYAAPDTVAISDAVYRLIQGYFVCHDLGRHTLKGVTPPIPLYRVLSASEAQSRLDVEAIKGLTPLVGRESEVTLLLERWEDVKAGRGQVVLLSGEAGIGKSRLLRVLTERLASEACTRIEYRCSPYHQHSALYPVIVHLQRVLAWSRDDTPQEKLHKLEQAFAHHPMSLQEVVPLFAALLAVPLPERYPPLTLTPQRQKQQTLEALLAWLLEEAAQQPVLFIVEDLHWVDPSTVEFLSLLVDQGSTACICSLLTFRPDFMPPWLGRAYLTPVSLSRFTRPQVETMIAHVVGGKALPVEVVEQIVVKTDGVPLFIEELTKTVLESGLLREVDSQYELTGSLSSLTIPTTLHDSLMARLDRLSTAKGIAQLGATIGRQFSYELLHVVSRLDEASLQCALERLVEAELLYQRGVLPQATYTFKHALIQEAAYQSLLKSKRQHYHQQIAQVLLERFPETQPELLAHHLTEAGLYAQAVGFWHQAGQTAMQRSANTEAIRHLTKGLEVLNLLPETAERFQHELSLQTILGLALTVTKGYGAPEVEYAYARARALCQQVGETPQLSSVLAGLRRFYLVRGDFRTALELGEQYLRLAQRYHDTTLRIAAYEALGATLLYAGEFAAARPHLEQGIAHAYAEPLRLTNLRHGSAPEVQCCSYLAMVLWSLGYPDQALQRNQEALTLAQQLAHPYSLAHALAAASFTRQFCRDTRITQAQAEVMMTLSTEQNFAYMLALSLLLHGWALAMQGQRQTGMAQMHQGMAALQAPGAEHLRPYLLILLAEAYRAGGHFKEGLHTLDETQAAVERSGSHFFEAELYRLKGELLLDLTMTNHTVAAACFHHALAIARRQQAKSLELRATTSLSRLWQRQGKSAEARQRLGEILGWFTEGFTTPDLQEAGALLEGMQA